MDLFLFVVFYVIFGFLVVNFIYGLIYIVKLVCDVYF